MFYEIYQQILPDDEDEDDDEEERKEEEQVNFFALKELMKLEYVLLTKTEPYFESMAHLWSNSKKHLIQVMDMLRYDDKQLKVEAILQFSLFLLRPKRSEMVINLMARNKDYLV